MGEKGIGRMTRSRTQHAGGPATFPLLGFEERGGRGGKMIFAWEGGICLWTRLTSSSGSLKGERKGEGEGEVAADITRQVHFSVYFVIHPAQGWAGQERRRGGGEKGGALAWKEPQSRWWFLLDHRPDSTPISALARPRLN